jgi:hypothetical protein
VLKLARDDDDDNDDDNNNNNPVPERQSIRKVSFVEMTWVLRAMFWACVVVRDLKHSVFRRQRLRSQCFRGIYLKFKLSPSGM